MASPAEASRYYMSYGQAKAETKRYAKEACYELAECTAWAPGRCLRRAPSRFSCVTALWFRGVEGEIICEQVLHWGVNNVGTIVLRSTGEPTCY